MLHVISFILNCVIDFAKMLFTINVGDGLNLGLLMCIVFIFLPMLLRIVYFLRGDVVEELNNRYDETRPTQTFTFTENEHYNSTTGKAYKTYNNKNSTTWRSRYHPGRSDLKRRLYR